MDEFEHTAEQCRSHVEGKREILSDRCMQNDELDQDQECTDLEQLDDDNDSSVSKRQEDENPQYQSQNLNDELIENQQGNRNQHTESNTNVVTTSSDENGEVFEVIVEDTDPLNS